MLEDKRKKLKILFSHHTFLDPEPPLSVLPKVNVLRIMGGILHFCQQSQMSYPEVSFNISEQLCNWRTNTKNQKAFKFQNGKMAQFDELELGMLGMFQKAAEADIIIWIHKQTQAYETMRSWFIYMVDVVQEMTDVIGQRGAQNQGCWLIDMEGDEEDHKFILDLLNKPNMISLQSRRYKEIYQASKQQKNNEVQQVQQLKIQLYEQRKENESLKQEKEKLQHEKLKEIEQLKYQYEELKFEYVLLKEQNQRYKAQIDMMIHNWPLQQG